MVFMARWVFETGSLKTFEHTPWRPTTIQRDVLRGSIPSKQTSIVLMPNNVKIDPSFLPTSDSSLQPKKKRLE